MLPLFQDTGALVVGTLSGELDIASTPIERQRTGSLAVNLSAAEAQRLERAYFDLILIDFQNARTCLANARLALMNRNMSNSYSRPLS